MNKNILSIALSVLAVGATFTPAVGLAYLAPEQVFGGQSLTLKPAPPLQREGEAVVQAQQERQAAIRAAEQSKLTSTQAEPVDTFVPDNSPQPLNRLDQNTVYQLRQERIANDKSSGGPTIIIGGDSTVRDGNGNVLHSGAPRVTATGPASVLAFAAMLLAALSTFAFAQIRSRRMDLAM